MGRDTKRSQEWRMMARKLPSFEYGGKLWTVDPRLKEFRFIVHGEMPEFVPFDSDKGMKLLEEWSRNTV